MSSILILRIHPITVVVIAVVAIVATSCGYRIATTTTKGLIFESSTYRMVSCFAWMTRTIASNGIHDLLLSRDAIRTIRNKSGRDLMMKESSRCNLSTTEPMSACRNITTQRARKPWEFRVANECSTTPLGSGRCTKRNSCPMHFVCLWGEDVISCSSSHDHRYFLSGFAKRFAKRANSLVSYTLASYSRLIGSCNSHKI